MTLLTMKQRKMCKRLSTITMVLIILMSVFDCIHVYASSSFSVSVSLSAESTKVSEAVLIKASAGGSSGCSPFKYRFLYSTDDGSSWRYCGTSDYSGSSQYTFIPSEHGITTTTTVRIKAQAQCNEGNAQYSGTKVLNVLPNSTTALQISSASVTPSNGYKIGTVLTAAATATGGTAPYTYQFSYKKSSATTYTVAKAYSATSSYTLNTSTWNAAAYDIKITVKDSKSATYSYVASVTLSATTPLVNSFTVPTEETIGGKIGLSASGADGIRPYTFTFSYYPVGSSGSKTTIASNTTGITTWDTKGMTAGNYVVEVKIADSKSSTVSKQATIKLTEPPAPSITLNVEPSVTKGSILALSATATGGTTPYTYLFEYQKQGDRYTPLTDHYGESSQQNLDTSSLEVGKYTCLVHVRDGNGIYSRQTCAFEITEPKIISHLNVSNLSPNVGAKITLSSTLLVYTDGNLAPYTYKFQYKRTSDSAWTDIVDYDSSNNIQFDTSDLEAVPYSVRVMIKDKNGSEYEGNTCTLDMQPYVAHTLDDLRALVISIDEWYEQASCGSAKDDIEHWKERHEKEDPELYAQYPFDWNSYYELYCKVRDAKESDSENFDEWYEDLYNQWMLFKSLMNSGEINYDGSNFVMNFTNGVFDCFKSVLKLVPDTLYVTSGATVDNETANNLIMPGGFNFMTAAETIYPIFQMIGYSLIVLFTGINALESAIQYEMFTLRGGVRIFARLFFAKVWVDLSLTICKAIIEISVGWLASILNLSNELLDTSSFDLLVNLPHSNLWVIGVIVDILNGLIMVISVIILLAILIIMLSIIVIKLLTRQFELAALCCVSPAFFACLAGEETKAVFKKFIMTFLSVVLEVVFMGIMYYIYCSFICQWSGGSGTIDISADFSRLFSVESGFIQFLLISICAFMLMIKPPKILRNLVTI